MYWVTLTAAVAYAFGIYLLLLMLQRLILRKPAPQSQFKPSFVLRTNFLRRAIR